VDGSSPGLAPARRSDYDAIGIPFEDRWKRFEEAVAILRALLGRAPAPEPARYYSLPDAELLPSPVRGGGIPLWIGSWGSATGLRRVARLADGWLASAYNTTPSASRPDASNWPASSPGTAAERPGSRMRS
jgi:alkanesulfonate monooxygenase SsuD/methylene tetrahydromethanopterin reductase-like flavin-dependent oxidoreductase (luciferase family)